MQVIDKSSGKSIEVPDDQVQAGFQAGAYNLPAGARIPIVRADGQVGTVPSEGLSAELQGGASVMPQADFAKHQNEIKYGGVGGTLAAIGEGAARGLTLGLSDPLAIGAAKAFGGNEAAEATRQHLQGEQQAHEIAAPIAELAGAIAPVVLSGGAAAPEEALALGAAKTGIRELGAISRATSEAGSLIEHGIGAVIGDNAPSLLARTAQKVVAKGAAGAFEGAVYGMGSEVSEDALGNKDLTGEKLLAAAGHGAVFGGLIGGGFGGLGTLGEAGITKIARSPTVQHIAEEQAWRSINPRKYFNTQAERVAGGYKGIGRELLDSGLIRAGDTVETIAPRITEARAATGEQIGGMLRELEQQGAEGVKVSTIVDNIKKNMPAAANQLEHTANTMGRVKDLITDLENLGAKNEGSIALSDLHATRANLDTIINWEKANPTPALQALRSARAAIESTLIDTADKEAARLGVSSTFKADFNATKQRFQKLAIADDAASDAVERMHANQSHSLTDKMFAMHGAELSGLAALTAGAGPVGLAVHAAGGLLAGQVSKVIRERGNATLAAWLDKVKDLAAIKQVTKRLDAKVAHETAKSLTGKVIKAEVVDTEDYDKVARRVKVAQANHGPAVSSHLGTIQVNAPGVSQSFSTAAERATQYLASKMPSEAPPTLFGKPPPPTTAEKLTLMRAARAIENPEVVLKDLRAGTLSPDTVEAVKTVYPQLWDEMRTKMIESIKKGDNMPYGRRLQVASLLDIDPDGTMNPAFMASIQQSYQAQGPTPKPGGKHRAAKVKGLEQGMSLTSRTALK